MRWQLRSLRMRSWLTGCPGFWSRLRTAASRRLWLPGSRCLFLTSFPSPPGELGVSWSRDLDTGLLLGVIKFSERTYSIFFKVWQECWGHSERQKRRNVCRYRGQEARMESRVWRGAIQDEWTYSNQIFQVDQVGPVHDRTYTYSLTVGAQNSEDVLVSSAPCQNLNHNCCQS